MIARRLSMVARSLRCPASLGARCGERAFTLLEIMVAVAILGLALTVILSAQGGLAASNRSAQNLGLAGNLGRCKMSELEEKLLRNGYPDIDETETSVSCCDSGDTDVFSCETKVEKVELPQPTSGSADAGLDLLGSFGASPLGSSTAGGAPATAPLASLDFDAGIAGLGSQVSQQLGAGGAGGMLDTVMAMVYPSLKGMMEASIRRVTVTVRWKEGPNVRELPLVQFVTNPQRSGLLAGFDGGAPPADGPPPGSKGGPK
jgi:general secretion pathway protein I